MYIPKPALEDCLTSEISASGGDVMYDYITGSQIRRVHYFGNTTLVNNVSDKSMSLRYIKDVLIQLSYS